MQQKTQSYLNITKKDLTKKYIRQTITYQKLLQLVENTFAISNRNYYAVYYKSNSGSPRYLRNKKQFEEIMSGEGVDELFIDKREQGEEALEDSGKESKKTAKYNQSLAQALQQLKKKHSESISNIQVQTMEEVNKRLAKKSLQLKSNCQRKMKISLNQWRESCSFCKRAIKGVKYECASCEIYSCEGCERDKASHEPSSTHVFIKIVDQKHQIKKKQLKNKQQRRKFVLENQALPKADVSDDINTLVEFLQIPKAQAVELMRRNLGKNVNQLIDMYLK